MQIVQNILLATHVFGLAIIVGPFILQMRKKEGFATGLILTGAIIQLVTGLAMVGIGEAVLDDDYNSIKIAVKLGIALIVLVGAIGARVAEKKGKPVTPWFHTAGGMAAINILIAAIWR
ncbi:MAG: hypothetical protein EAS51_01100 [Microbacteriaceae bacterium]|nr:MAG: hypothetical protein EAS51_01100 [Microbacteriaceae bacterium]